MLNQNKPQSVPAVGGLTKDPGNSFAVSAPQVVLPKGGGAIRGIGEKFGANPVTGTGSMTIPIATSPGRSGFGPQLSLSYDSGAGNGPFGLGWHLSIPSIARKTDKGLPRYRDAEDLDVFVLSGAEDLVPVYRQDVDGKWIASRAEFQRDTDGFWVRDSGGALVVHEDEFNGYCVRRYRPRIEGLFARIERWTNIDPAKSDDVFWRSISKDNITALYGKTDESRIVDPANPTRIFSWMICESHDDKGNAIIYRYRAEDSTGVDVARANERNRTRSATRHLKRILYGNAGTCLDEAGNPPLFFDEDRIVATPWLFETVFDYGDHDLDCPKPMDNEARNDSGALVYPWPARADSFSSYRSGFEVRTYRLCQRVLMFHHFPDLPSGEKRYDGLVRSTDFKYSCEENPKDIRNPIYSFLLAVSQTGYKRQPAGDYLKKSVPPVEFTYSEAKIQKEIREVDSSSLENLPSGLDGSTYQWVDLDGEGLSGILTEQADGWFYKRNLSSINIVGGDGIAHDEARFAPVELVAAKPVSGLPTGAQFMDLAGDGQLDLVNFRGPTPGFYERTPDAGSWESLTPFASLPVLDWNDPNLKFVDLTGDGHADLLITEDDVFRWYPSLAEAGFGPQETSRQSFDEETGPRLIFADGTEANYLADMSGDGLTDLVRIRNGEICYWPNLGYGRFGAKVTMDNSPWFDFPEQFDQKRIRLADVDGSGLIDIIYLHGDGVRVYFNQSGNGWSQPPTIPAFPRIDRHTSVTVIDLLGNGTACLVWSSPLPGDAGRQMRYIDLMGGQKPHLLVKTVNNLGAETVVSYAPSTKFYLQDKQAGRPWITKLPFPVHCVERVTVTDKWRQTSFSTTYSYHHGYFDGFEREFRGFGRVEQVDVESYGKSSEANATSPYVTVDQTLYQPPIKTITWFHTGAAVDRQRILTQFEEEYFPNSLATLPSTVNIDPVFKEKPLPEPDLESQHLSAEEWREALRACKGMTLRQEVYELDVAAMIPGPGTPPREIPVRLFSAATHNCCICCLQPIGDNPHAVFLVTEIETLSYHYELELRPFLSLANATTGQQLKPDPRIAHTFNLSFDEYGNVQQSVAVAYPRERTFSDPTLVEFANLIQEVQSECHVSYTETHFTTDTIGPESATAPVQYYRLRVPCEVQTYELTGIFPKAGDYFDIENFLELELSSRYLPVSPSKPVARKLYHELPQDASAAMRLVEHARTLFFADDPTASDAATKFLKAPLPLGTLGRLGLAYQQYKLALTDTLLEAVFTEAQLNQNVPCNQSIGSARNILNKSTISGYLCPVDAVNDFGQPAAGEYWMRSGIAGFASDAGQHFYLPEDYTDAFGNRTTLRYDGEFDLFIQSHSDALGNTVTTERFDYRVLAPLEMTDPNGNFSAVAFDILGLPVASAVMGKNRTESGDDLTGLELDPPIGDVEGFLTNAYDKSKPVTWLGKATARFIYDFGLGVDNHGAVSYGNRPASACGVVRETHVNAVGEAKIQVGVQYSDGMGAVLVKKSQAEPDPTNKATDAPLRWIASGKTILNNKGKPVKQYEPYFSETEHRFDSTETESEIGVTPIMYYDAAGRLMRTELPNGTFSRVEFSPWHARTFDANDTVLESQWFVERGSPNAALPEPVERAKRAAWLAAQHYDTPSVTMLDSLGREVISIAQNRVKNDSGEMLDEKYLTFTKLDAEGKPLWIRDARGNLVMQYVTPTKPIRAIDELDRTKIESIPSNSVPCYDIAGNLLFQHSMDAGGRWMITDAVGKPMLVWDRNQRQDEDNTMVEETREYFTAYDALHRPTAQWLGVNDGAGVMVERFEYHDTRDVSGTLNPRFASIQDANLIGQLGLHYDPSGLTETIRLDLDGNVGEVRRRLNNQPKESLIDWQGESHAALEAKLETETFIQITEFDALKRMTLHYNWHRMAPNNRVAVYRPAYNARGLLQKETLTVRARKTASGFDLAADTTTSEAIKEICYNAKGQKERMVLGNGTITCYDYDERTFSLRQLRTSRLKTGQEDPEFPDTASNLKDGRILQQLFYTYDPVGNITEIEDQAYKPVFFDQGIAEPKSRYEYDALYRLIFAEGRETAQGGDAACDSTGPEIARGFPITDQTQRRYAETYTYDPVGNFVEFRHAVVGDSGSSWTRNYTTAADSNRLLRTWMGTKVWDETPVQKRTEYEYDTHGNMLNLANTDPRFGIRWDQRDMIRIINLGGGGQAYYQYDTSKQRTRKYIERNGSGNLETIYLGGYELYRRTVSSKVVEEIESHHLFEGEQRVLLVDDVITASGASSPRSDGLTVKAQSLFRYQYSNHLGSAALELDHVGEIISYEEYHPYGTSAYRAINGQIEAPPKRYRYTGKERDEESELYYHGARYYAAWLGRWTSFDPEFLNSGINLYVLVDCRPTILIDPNGRAPGIAPLLSPIGPGSPPLPPGPGSPILPRVLPGGGMGDGIPRGLLKVVPKAAAATSEAGASVVAFNAAVGVALVGSLVLVGVTIHSAASGEPTPIDIADKFYGTHFGDIVGWVVGRYSSSRATPAPELEAPPVPLPSPQPRPRDDPPGLKCPRGAPSIQVYGSVNASPVSGKSRATGPNFDISNAKTYDKSMGEYAGQRKPPGFLTGFDNRCHLISRERGGDNKPHNIVPCFWKPNQQGEIREIELQIREMALADRSGNVCTFTTPVYEPGVDRPVAINYIAVDSNGNRLVRTVQNYVGMEYR